MLKSENLSLTFFKKLPLTPSLSPLGERGRVRGISQISLARSLE
jgi:hypothetical protein